MAPAMRAACAGGRRKQRGGSEAEVAACVCERGASGAGGVSGGAGAVRASGSEAGGGGRALAGGERCGGRAGERGVGQTDNPKGLRQCAVGSALQNAKRRTRNQVSCSGLLRD